MQIVEAMSIDDIKSNPNQAHQTITKLLDEREREATRFKQDCRRTAMQLASRSSSGTESMVVDAQKIYEWLTEPITDNR